MNVSVILDETAVSHFAASWARYDLVLVKGLLASVAALVTIALYHVKTRQVSIFALSWTIHSVDEEAIQILSSSSC